LCIGISISENRRRGNLFWQIAGAQSEIGESFFGVRIYSVQYLEYSRT
jgi:hypothetical protein